MVYGQTNGFKQGMASGWTNGFKHRTWLMCGQMVSNIGHGFWVDKWLQTQDMAYHAMGGQMASNIGHGLWLDKLLQTQNIAYFQINGSKHRTWPYFITKTGHNFLRISDFPKYVHDQVVYMICGRMVAYMLHNNITMNRSKFELMMLTQICY